MNDLVWVSATQRAPLDRTGEVSPVEVIGAVLDRLEAVNRIINAFVTAATDRAREQGRVAEAALQPGEPVAPLCEVPVTVKGLAETVEVRTIYRRKSLRDNVPDFDAISWEWLKAAGAILMGKATTPEYRLLGVTERGLTGTPWDPMRASGGSSVGAAAATVAGVWPLAWRRLSSARSAYPPRAAEWFGGVKPRMSRIPTRHNTDGASTDGPTTRTVGDAALMTTHCTARTPGYRRSAPLPGSLPRCCRWVRDSSPNASRTPSPCAPQRPSKWSTPAPYTARSSSRIASHSSAPSERSSILGLDLTDLTEVKTLHVEHPDQVARLAGGTFLSPWFQVDAARADLFHRGTCMDLYAHPYAAEAYGEGLVEGFHLLGLLDYLLNTVLWAEGDFIAWNYGLDKVRFVTVIRYSDRFRLRGTVRDVVDRAELGKLLVVDVTGEVAGRTQPGFVATLRLLWRGAATTDRPACTTTGEATAR